MPVSHEADVVNELFFVQFKNPERLSGSCFVTFDHAGHVENMMVQNISSNKVTIQKGQCLCVLVQPDPVFINKNISSSYLVIFSLDFSIAVSHLTEDNYINWMKLFRRLVKYFL